MMPRNDVISKSGMHKRGFTLIELLVVIAIIGMLSSVILASLGSARKKSRDSKRIADMRQIATALQFYYDKNGDYPDCLYTGNNDTGSACGTLLEGSGFLPTISKDPLTGAQYSYSHISPRVGAVNCSSPRSYHLGTSLEDRTNPVLINDADTINPDVANGGRCFIGTNYGFYGLSAAAGGQKCSTGTNGTTLTETCYDVRP